MPRIELPVGEYIHHCRAVRPEYGGRTRAMLMRTRLLAEYAGVPTRITTYDEAAVYDDVRGRLRELGLLGKGVDLLNLFEYYREADVDGRRTVTGRVPKVDGLIGHDELHPDGTVYRTTYGPDGTGAGTDAATVVDFRRADGTVYLRMLRTDGRAGRHYLLDTSGRLVGRWRHRTAWARDWIKELVPENTRGFVFVDKAPFLVSLLPLPPHLHVIAVMHSTHIAGERRWDSPMPPMREEMLDNIAALDGLVTLTDWQRQDVIARYGDTDNLFVVPNPVVPAEVPDPAPVRDRARFVVLARLESVKRLGHALRAVARARRQEPDVTLDIFGDGDQRAKLEQLAAELGISDAVTFHGFDPHARSSLWTATGYLLTSRTEGYPLSTLEAMSHGCPVVSYDLKYGPRDQVTEGVDGFLVESGDVKGLADRMLALVRDPDLTGRMSVAAVRKAEKHDPEAFVRDWQHVLEAVVLQSPTRTTLKSCSVRVSRLGYARPGPSLGRLGRLGRPVRVASSQGAPPRLGLHAHLQVRGSTDGAGLDSARVTLEAICSGTGEIVVIPTKLRRSGRAFGVAASFAVADLFAHDVADVRLRLRLTWHNSSWQEDLARVTRSGGTERVAVLRFDGSRSVSAPPPRPEPFESGTTRRR